jgi:hypothetical protein
MSTRHLYMGELGKDEIEEWWMQVVAYPYLCNFPRRFAIPQLQGLSFPPAVNTPSKRYRVSQEH